MNQYCACRLFLWNCRSAVLSTQTKQKEAVLFKHLEAAAKTTHQSVSRVSLIKTALPSRRLHVPTVFKMLFFKTESWNQFTVTSVLWMTNRRFTTEWSFHPEQKQWRPRITCYLSNNQQDMKRLQTARLIRNVNTDVFNTSTCSREFILLEKKKSPSSHHVQVTLLQTYKQKYSLGQKKTFQTLQRIKNFQKIFTNIFFPHMENKKIKH